MKKFTYNLIAFIIPSVILLIISLLLGLWPVSSKSFLISDMWSQYYIFSDLFWKNIISGNNLDFSNILGGGISTEFINVYYALHPLGVLTLFDNLISPSGIGFLMVSLYLGIASLSMTIYCNTKENSDKKLSLIAGLSYAFCGWATFYIFNVIWMWGFAIFPILLLFLKKILNEENKIKNGIMYSIVLSSIIISNFFIAFIICIFLVFYVLFSYIFKSKDIKNIAYFIGFSFIAGMIASPVILIILQTIMGKPSGVLKDVINPSIFESILSFIKGLFPLNNKSVTLYKEYTCYSYTNLLFAIGAIMFFLSKKIDKNYKKLNACLLFVLTISMLVYSIEKIWYGFDSPDGLYRRMSFLFSFIVIDCGYDGLIKENESMIEKNKLKILALVLVVPVVILLIINMSSAIFSLVFISIYILLYKKNKKKYLYSLVTFELIITLFFSICINGYTLPNKNKIIINDFNQIDRYVNFDENFNNDSKVGTYSLYASGIKLDLASFIHSINANCGNSFYTLNATVLNVISSIFSIDYLYSENELNIPYYEFYKKVDNLNIYKNMKDLPIAYIVSENVNNYVGMSNDIFENINELSYILSNREAENIYDDVNIHIKTENNKLSFVADKDYQCLIFNSKVLNNKDTSFFETKIYINNNIYYNGKIKYNYNKSIHLNNIKKNDIIEIVFECDKNSNIDNIKLKSMDLNSFNILYENLADEVLTDVSYYEGTYKGKIYSKNDNSLLMFTIPYDKNFKAYIDGKEIEVEKILKNAFCGVRVDKGTHEVVLEYENNILFYSYLVSGIGLLILFIIYFKNRRRKNHENI